MFYGLAVIGIWYLIGLMTIMYFFLKIFENNIIFREGFMVFLTMLRFIVHGLRITSDLFRTFLDKVKFWPADVLKQIMKGVHLIQELIDTLVGLINKIINFVGDLINFGKSIISSIISIF